MTLAEIIKTNLITDKKFALLTNVSTDTGKASQSNKFYSLFEQVDGTIKIVRGRIDASFVVEPKTPSIHEWDKIIKSKTQRSKDAYTNITHLFTEAIAAQPVNTTTGAKTTVADIADKVVKKLFDELQAYANKSIAQNYTVEVKMVTQAMIDEAQKIVDSIATKIKINCNTKELNEELMKLFRVIPRKMANVKSHLFDDIKSKADVDKAQNKIADEQATLDVMAGQVDILNKQKATELENSKSKSKPKQIDFLQQIGLEAEHVTDKTTLAMINAKMQENAKRVGNVYKVINKRTQAAFDKHLAQAKNKKTTLLFHGSRNGNWLSIIEKGLLIRPAGAGYSGSMWDDGIYGASESAKSLNYTGSAYATNSYVGGSEPKVYLALFEFHTGNQLDMYQHTSESYKISKRVKAEGYDCVWAHKGPSLYRDEIIVYDPAKVTIKYLIEVK